MRQLHLPAATLVNGVDGVSLPPARAGWRYTGLDVLRLGAREVRTIDTRRREQLVLPLAGSFRAVVDGVSYELAGRRDVFAAATDFVYVPVDSELTITSDAEGEVALPWAFAEQGLPVAYVSADQVALEVRGAGQATRLIREVFTEGATRARRLAVVEVVTPRGNWSSYPPHKHDDASSGREDELEEIYYYRIDGVGGWGVHRTYTADRTIDETVTVRNGDVFLVPRGYHGPCIAPPEYDMWYLNVLAGASGARGLRYSDDPAYAWIRDSWRSQQPDTRVLALRDAAKVPR
jgi:5-deoxy-glucuronate isomerase